MNWQLLLDAVAPYVLQVAALIVAAVVARAALYAEKNWKIKIEESQRKAITDAIVNGINFALSKGNSLHQPALKEMAKNYVDANLPDTLAAMKKKGVPVDAQVDRKITAVVQQMIREVK